MSTWRIGHKKNRVLMIVGLYHPVTGGTEKECQKIARGLKEKGVSVAILTQHCEGFLEYEEIDGIPVYRKMRGWHFFEITYMLSVLFFLIRHRGKYDIVQCFGLYLFIPPVVVMKYLFGKKVVARLECSGCFGDLWRINQLRWKNVVKVCAKWLDAIIVISKDIERELVENGFPEERFITIHNSVEIHHFKPREVTTEKTPIKTICFVGRLELQKGVEYLLRAIPMVRSKGHEVNTMIVGDGSLQSFFRELCHQLVISEYVEFVGATDDVLPYYRESHLFVLPSIAEGMSLALIEAMACGLPVIATTVGGNAEVLCSQADGLSIGVGDFQVVERGILVNPGDVGGLACAIVRLLEDENLSFTLGIRARRYVEEQHPLEKIINSYITLYRGLSKNR